MRLFTLLLLALAIPATAQTTFTVTTTADNGAGSLRQAITDANANAGADVIAFNIPGAGPHTITPASALPTITDPVTIDGLTQPGASCDAQPATLQIVLSGPGTQLGTGLDLETDDSLLRGLVVNGSFFRAVVIDGSRNALECNYIGLDATGTTREPVNFNWVEINGESCEDNRIGGPSLNQRNVMAGSRVNGLRISCDRTVIQGNYLGLNAAGTEMMGSTSTAVRFDSGNDHLLGGPNAGEGNVIAGNDGIGSTGNVSVSGAVERIRIQGNIIGAGPDGEVIPPGNGFRPGLLGITFDFASSQNTESPRYLIGGVEPGAGNLIAGHTLWGVRVPGQVNASDPPAFAAILGNRIFDNGNPSPNRDGELTGPAPGMDFNIDMGDRGAGAGGEDNGQFPNAPDLNAKPSLTTTTSATVQGTLNDAPNQAYRIEVFAGQGCAPTRLAHAKYFIGAFDVTTDGSGLATFNQTLATSGVPEGSVIGVTATTIVDGSAENGRTSELSACEAFPTDPLLVDRTGDLTEFGVINGENVRVSILPGSFRSAIEYANATPGRDEIRFAIPMSQPNCDGATGTCLVQPMDDLPTITEAVVIDGLTQPGASCDAWPATLKVALDGSNRYGARFDSNGLQVDVESGGETVIRGLAIHDFPRSGVRILDGAATITCNVIGTDITGNEERGNGEGVAVFSYVERGERTPRVQIGGSRVTDRNLISGNSRGINLNPFISSGILTDVVIQGNWIGTDVTGEAGLRNRTGIEIDENVFDVQIGGESREAANVIAFNGEAGIELDESNSEPDNHPRGIAILGNAIYGNNAFTSSPEPQIKLETASLANDAGDVDEGANRRQNSPLVSSAGALGFTLQVSYRVDTDPANATYPLRVEFFEAEDVGEHPGGVRYLGHDIYTAADFATGTDKEVRVLGGGTVVGGETVIATATDAAGNTSSFSVMAQAVSDEGTAALPATLALDAPRPNPVGAGEVRLRFAVPSAGPVRLDLVDALGRQVRQLVDQDLAAGWYPLELTTDGLAPGVYVLRLSANSTQAVRTLTVVR